MQAPGETLILRMWETLTERGIGALLRPWQMRREGRASIEIRKQELLELAQAEADAVAIRAGQRRLGPDGVFIPAASISSTQEPAPLTSAEGTEPRRLLLEAVTDSAIADATRREVNVARAILFAEEELQQQANSAPAGGPAETEPSPDPDWLYRWRDAASEVSAEELQHLWGRVLAGEVRAPGTFSLRTLEFLRNISRSEAEAIELLARYSLGDVIYCGEPPLLEAQGMNLSFLLAMQDLGVISGVGGLGLTLTIRTSTPDMFEKAFIIGHRVVIVAHADAQKNLVLPIYVVTRLGQEVFRLAAPEPSDLYLRDLGAAAISQGFEAHIASGYWLSDGSFQYFNAERIASPSPSA